MTQYYHKRYSEIKIDVMSEALDDAMKMAPSHLILCIDMKSLLDVSDIIKVLPASLVEDLKNHNKGTYQGSDIAILNHSRDNPPMDADRRRIVGASDRSPLLQGDPHIESFKSFRTAICIS